MNPEHQFIIEHWEKKSNAILGFVVIQSIILADALAKEEFMTKIKSVNLLPMYLFLSHSLIVVLSVFFLALIDVKVSKKLENEKQLKKDIELHKTLVTKVVLALIFGLIPIFIFTKSLF